MSAFYTHIDDTLSAIVKDGLYKSERLITSKQASGITVSENGKHIDVINCLLYTSPSPRDRTRSRMPSSA